MKADRGSRIKFQYRHSLKRQMAAVFILLTGFTLVSCWLVNVFFLERLYLKNKQNNLLEIYALICAAHDEGSFGNEDTDRQILSCCNTYNVDFVVTDASSNTLYSNIRDPEQVNRQLRDIMFSRDNLDREIISENDNYHISFLRDPVTGSEFITMWGYVGSDCFFMLRTALESIKDSVRMANRTLLVIGVLAMLISAVVIWFITRKITEPVMDLVDVSKRMANLDFETKYQGKSNTEIGVLGENMNILSNRLEETISHLKTANLELQRDVEARRSTDERRKEFLASVSHELKTPIALIQGYAEGLKEGVSEDAESREYYCDVIIDETKKMNHLVMRLMSLGQVEAGEEVAVMERFDLNELIVQSIDSFSHLCEQKGVKLFYEENKGLFVWADESQVEEVLRNYMSNALNHCTGKKEIVIKTERLEGRVRTGVFNSGEPIPEEHISRIWDKFYKVDKARTREYGGSGLGLSIVKALMESMHQGYGVVNYSDGVEFWFELETK